MGRGHRSAAAKDSAPGGFTLTGLRAMLPHTRTKRSSSERIHLEIAALDQAAAKVGLREQYHNGGQLMKLAGPASRSWA